MKGFKDDSNKLQWHLMPWEPLQEVVKVLMFGAKKYAPDNWQHVDNAQERYFNAAARHLIAYKIGITKDEESNLPAVAHSICCLLFLLWHDSRPPKGKSLMRVFKEYDCLISHF